MDRYRVFGHPISHSRSPEVHAHFAAQTGETIVYDRQDPGESGFADAFRAFVQEGGKGANVTLPFKQQAMDLADDVSGRAKSAGAANTLKVLSDGSIYADNTDGPGLVRDLQQNLGLTLPGKRVLMLGAGGAARGVIGPLLSTGIDSLHVANRTVARAEEIIEPFRMMAMITAGPLNQLPAGGFDLLINATSASVHGEALALDPDALREDGFCYDMAYSGQGTPFTRWAEEHGFQHADGWGMMVEQAAESFQIWRDVRPDTQELIKNRIK